MATAPEPDFPFKPGDYITWIRDSLHAVRISSVDRFHVIYECRDGVSGFAEANIFHTLAEATADWRPATPEAIAFYDEHYQPAPQNWF